MNIKCIQRKDVFVLGDLRKCNNIIFACKLCDFKWQVALLPFLQLQFWVCQYKVNLGGIW